MNSFKKLIQELKDSARVHVTFHDADTKYNAE